MGSGVVPLSQRFPLLTPDGRAVLDDLLEADDAPVWNHRAGDRLDGPMRDRVRAYAARLATDPPRWAPGGRPGWVDGHLARAARVVPRLRREEGLAPPFTTSRADLVAAWWDLVPDDVDVDALIWFPTSGTGGTPAIVPTHPVAVASYYPLLLAAARLHGVEVRFRPDRADWVTVVDQAQGGFTVPSWSSVLGCGTAKVNLDPSGWRAEGDRARFLRRHDPQVLTGDPVSLSTLAQLDLGLSPRVALSTALRLTAATRTRLETALGCPVVDVYSTTESGPIAAARPQGGMALLQPGLHVEVVDAVGHPLPPGEVGDLVLTGGLDPYLPLVRYRTGDTGRLHWSGATPVLHDLAGRPVVHLRGPAGAVASLDVVQVLEPLPLRRWAVRQAADDAVTVAVEAEVGAPDDLDAAVTAALRVALGEVAVSVVALDAPDMVLPFVVEEPS